MRASVLSALLVIPFALWLIGCGGGGSSTITGVGAPGTVRLVLADAPLAGVSAVNVQVVKISLLYDGVEDSLKQNPTDNDPDPDSVAAKANETLQEDSNDQEVTLYAGDMTINLLTLANQPMTQLLQMAQTAVPSGYYTQVRLYLGDNCEIVKDDGTHAALTVPSGKLRFPLGLYVSPQELETLVLDFDLAKSLLAPTQGHGYKLMPVLHISTPETSGSITGTLQLPAGTQLTEALDAQVVVTPAVGEALETDVEFDPDEDANTGRFYLHGVPPGTATVQVKIGDQTVAEQQVTVETGKTADLGTITLPAW